MQSSHSTRVVWSHSIALVLVLSLALSACSASPTDIDPREQQTKSRKHHVERAKSGIDDEEIGSKKGTVADLSEIDLNKVRVWNEFSEVKEPYELKPVNGNLTFAIGEAKWSSVLREGCSLISTRDYPFDVQIVVKDARDPNQVKYVYAHSAIDVQPFVKSINSSRDATTYARLFEALYFEVDPARIIEDLDKQTTKTHVRYAKLWGGYLASRTVMPVQMNETYYENDYMRGKLILMNVTELVMSDGRMALVDIEPYVFEGKHRN